MSLSPAPDADLTECPEIKIETEVEGYLAIPVVHLFSGFHCFHFPMTKNWHLSFKPALGGL